MENYYDAIITPVFYGQTNEYYFYTSLRLHYYTEVKYFFIYSGSNRGPGEPRTLPKYLYITFGDG